MLAYLLLPGVVALLIIPVIGVFCQAFAEVLTFFVEMIDGLPDRDSISD